MVVIVFLFIYLFIYNNNTETHANKTTKKFLLQSTHIRFKATTSILYNIGTKLMNLLNHLVESVGQKLLFGSSTEIYFYSWLLKKNVASWFISGCERNSLNWLWLPAINDGTLFIVHLNGSETMRNTIYSGYTYIALGYHYV